MLKGQAKKDYQREYMRLYRAGLTRSNGRSNTVEVIEEWTPEEHTVSIGGVVHRAEPNLIGKTPIKIIDIDADGNPVYEESL